MLREVQYEQDYKRIVQADSYTLTHFATHLHHAGKHEKLYQLLVGNRAWTDAKYLHFGSDAMYVADLELAITDFTDPLQPEQIIPLIQLHTALQVIYQKSDVYTDIDLKTLIHLGYAARAADSARLRVKAPARFSGIMTVYNTLRDTGITDIGLLRDAGELLEVYPTYPSHINKDNAAVQLISAFAQAGYYTEAIEIHTTLAYQNNGMRSIGEIAAALAEAQHFSDAFDVLSSGDDLSRTYALPRIALAQAKAGLWADVGNTIADLIDIRQSNAFILCEIAIELLHQGNDAQARKMFSDLRNEAQKLPIVNHIEVLCRLGTGFSEVGRLDEAKEVFGDVKEKVFGTINLKPQEQTLMLLHTINGSLKAGIVEELDTLLSALFETGSDKDVERHSQEIISSLVEAGQTDKALNIIESHFHQVENQVHALCTVAVALKRSGHDHQFHQLFNEMLILTRSTLPETTKLETLREVAHHLAKSGIKTEAQLILDEVTKDALAIADPRARSLSYMGFAHALTKKGAFEKALAVANYSPSEAVKFATLRNVVFGLVDADCLDKALDTALDIPETNASRMEALREVAIGFARSGKINETTKLREELYSGVHNWMTDVSPQVSQALSRLNHFSQALRIARTAPSIEGKVASLRVVSAILLQKGHQDQGMQICDEAYQELNNITDVHKRAVESANLAYYAEALAIAESLQPSGNKSIMLRDIALALALSSHFDEALKIARDQLNGEFQSAVLREVGRKLCQLGKREEAKSIFDEAFESIRSNFDDVRDGNAIIELVTVLARCKLFDYAIKALSMLPETPDSNRNAALRNLIPELVRQNQLADAFDFIGTRSLDNFLYVISYCCPAIEQIKPGSTVEVLTNAARISAWISPDWAEIYALLTN